LIQQCSDASLGLKQFANSERDRFRDRIQRLPDESTLKRYELSYGLELGSDSEGPKVDWNDPHAVQAYPASVRARRIAVAIRCGQRQLGKELARAARAVILQLEFHLMGNHLLENAIALVCAASVTRGPEAELWWQIGSALLTRELVEQFLADGGHFELSASYHLALTAGLLEAIALVEGGERQTAQLWRDVATKALQWALSVEAPDGTYPLFNDASLDSAPPIHAVVELGRSCGIHVRQPPRPATGPWFSHLSSTGWIVAGSGGDLWLCIDVARDGAPYQPGHVHADALTFELWVGGQRTIVDYGVASYAVDAARADTRATRSHNTVEIDGCDSSEVWNAFRVGRRCKAWINAIECSREALVMEMEHDGYSWLAGNPSHRRRFSIEQGRVRVQDWVIGGGHRGMSRLRLDAKAKGRVSVTTSSPVQLRNGSWYPKFADPHAAIVLEQVVSDSDGCEWSISRAST
jgi:uncharacterized heparinase superfamily protein